jgi:eukaryotic-like serine/threonine-protein kinase
MLMSLAPGVRLGPYEIQSLIGAGGMGEVYKARDPRLGRDVAVKVLPPSCTSDPDASERLVHEARAASALQHHNICTVHEIGEAPDGQVFICMDYYEGDSLKKRIDSGPVPVAEALDITLQIARGLAEAHGHGIVHRDIKPANILLTRSGEVKIVDFGLARQPGQTELTTTGSTVGTPAYMSPEQLRGEEVNAATDVWSLGVTIYEMLTGIQPFKGGTATMLSMAILDDEPAPVEQLRPEVPPALAVVVRKALAKDRASRYRDAGELAEALTRVEQGLREPVLPETGPRGILRHLRKPAVWVPLSLVLLAAVLGGGLYARRAARVRWARQVAIPRIVELVAAGRMTSDESKFAEAFALAREAEHVLPADSKLTALWPEFSRQVTITSDPPGARVSRAPYTSRKVEWQEVGVTPVERARIPLGFQRWKLEKPGFETVIAVSGVRAVDRLQKLYRVLDAKGTIPESMVRVVVNPSQISEAWRKELAARPPSDGAPAAVDFFIDRYEVTNVEYRRFVEAGGYRDRTYWKHEFVKGGKKLTWDQAIREFVDATGRPGPSTWEAGRYPAGQDDYPVSGVSWYEAAAFAAFAGKELPTGDHWQLASALANEYSFTSRLAPLSNFGGPGPARVGSTGSLDAFGEYDLAGNVREWCWNQTLQGRRMRGGAWSDFTYMYADESQAPPFDRSATNGFRLVRYIDRAGIPAVAFAPSAEPPVHDYRRETPVPDAIFKVYRDQFSYARTELHPKTEARDERATDWIREKVSFDAAYGNERMTAILFLPRNAKPPFQAVVFFPGNPSNIYTDRSDRTLVGESGFDFIVRNGRAVVYPIYYGTYERNQAGIDGDKIEPTAEYRDLYSELVVKWVRDFMRTVDYLETRPDIDHERLAYYGWSWGAQLGAVVTAVEERMQASVLYLGGLYGKSHARPEALEINYAPHVRVPTLMLNGRYDLTFPLQTCVQPMFDLLATPPERKKLLLYDTDHYIPRKDLIRETLAWFDKYLGPVNAAAR